MGDLIYLWRIRMTEDASAVQKWKELAGKQQKAIETLRSSVDKLRAQNQILRQCIPVSNFLSFAQRSLRYIDCARSAVYVAHGVETLPAAHVLAAQAGRPFWCDVIEIPSFSHRSIARNWTPAARSVLEASTSWYLSQCQGLLTV